MAMGKAIIASNVDGTSEIIRHQHNGWLVETQDLVHHLTHALIAAASDGTARMVLGRNAMQTVSDRFNASDMTRQIEKIYLQLLAAKHPVPESIKNKTAAQPH